MSILKNLAFKTNPSILHCPGDLSPFFKDVQEALLEKKETWKESPDLAIYTINTPPHGRPDKPCGIFEESLRHFGIEPYVCSDVEYSAAMKIKWHIWSLAKSDKEYSLFADSCDVLMLDSPEVVLEKFKSLDVEVLFCPDMGFGLPQTPKFVEFLLNKPEFNGSGRLGCLNSGVFIGKTKTLVSFLACAHQQFTQGEVNWVNDQSMIQKAWMSWDGIVQVDSYAKIIQNAHQYLACQCLERPAWDHSTALAELIKKLPHKDRIFGVEVGVFDGRNASYQLRTFPNLYLWMIDPWSQSKDPDPNWFFIHLKQNDFDEHKAKALRSTEFAWDRRIICQEPSIKAAAYFEEKSVDYVLIDAEHRFEAVRQDAVSWWPKVREGGYLIFHDYAYQPDETKPWGVKKAVHQFASAKNLTVQVSGIGDIAYIQKV